MSPEKAFLNSLAVNQIQVTQKFLIALSGGGDSVALLCIAAKCLGTELNNLSACRVAHGIRSADEDEAENRYCEELCDRLKIPFSVVSIPEGEMSARARKNGQSIEQQARSERHRELEKKRSNLGADWIMFGHTAEDRLETIMMRVLEGSGPEGLKGIPEKRSRIIRPLLGVTRESLRTYLRERQIEWMDDSSNGQLIYRRNRVRLELLPLVQEIFPGWASGLSTLGERSEEVNHALEMFAEEKLPCVRDSESVRWSLSLWEKAPPYLKARALWNAYNQLSYSFNNEKRWSWRSVVQARAALDRGNSWKLFGFHLFRTDNEIVFRRDEGSSTDADDGIRVLLDRHDVENDINLLLGGYRFQASFRKFSDSLSIALATQEWPMELKVSTKTGTVRMLKKNNMLGMLPDAGSEIVYISVKYTG